jgi:hypothetical protein
MKKHYPFLRKADNDKFSAHNADHNPKCIMSHATASMTFSKLHSTNHSEKHKPGILQLQFKKEDMNDNGLIFAAKEDTSA